METAHIRVGNEVGLGAKAPDAELTGSEGTVFLSSFWEAQPIVLVLLNYLEPEAAVDHVLTLRDTRATFDDAGGDVVAVVRNTPEEIAAFRNERNVTLPLLSDEAGKVHRAYQAPATGPASFVIDTGGVVRFAHRASTLLDTPSTWDLIDAVCGLTGEVVERPEPSNIIRGGFAPHSDSATAFHPAISSVPPVASVHDFTCKKCGSGSYEIVKVATSGGWLSRLFNFQYRNFVAVVCGTCNFAELYRSKGGTAANIADILVGG